MQISSILLFMSLIQQFLQQNLYKNLQHQVRTQIQKEHEAADCLLTNLSNIRTLSQQQVIQSKIDRANKFLQLKKDVLESLQTNTIEGFERWIDINFSKNGIVREIIRKQPTILEKQVRDLIKRIFLSEQSLNQHFDETQITNSYIQALHKIKSIQLNHKIPQRALLVKIDVIQQQFQQHFYKFKQKTQNFDFQMLKIAKRLFTFEDSITQTYRNIFTTPQQDQINNIQFNNIQKTPNTKLTNQQIDRVSNQSLGNYAYDQSSKFTNTQFNRVSSFNTLSMMNNTLNNPNNGPLRQLPLNVRNLPPRSLINYY